MASLVDQFRNVLVVLLLIATGISAALWMWERDAPLPYEALAILAVVLLNPLMGYLQQSRALGHGEIAIEPQVCLDQRD